MSTPQERRIKVQDAARKRKDAHFERWKMVAEAVEQQGQGGSRLIVTQDEVPESAYMAAGLNSSAWREEQSPVDDLEAEEVASGRREDAANGSLGETSTENNHISTREQSEGDRGKSENENEKQRDMKKWMEMCRRMEGELPKLKRGSSLP